MDRRRAVEVGALVWAGVGAAIAIPSLATVNADARLLVGTAAILGPLAAVGAWQLLQRQADRMAGALLLVSVLTPTYFAYVVNLPALVVGLLLVTIPHLVLDGPRSTAAPSRPA